MDIYGEYLQLARLAMSGRKADIVMLLRRTLRRTGGDQVSRPEFQEKLRELLSHSEDTGEPMRRISMAPTAGRPNASEFVYLRQPKTKLTPVWPPSVRVPLESIISERQKLVQLQAAQVEPTRTLLFIGPPGVGKTLAAEWLAQTLGRELMILDLASVMSSYLGRTGSNLSAVLEEAANSNAVLLLDEFDSIGKRRDDHGDIGELKRLANVLLQALDRWSSDGMLIAATNHPDLLDRAVWRRFDRVIEFPMPEKTELRKFSLEILNASGFTVSDDLKELVAIALSGTSFAEAKLWLTQCIRSAITSETNITDALSAEVREMLDRKSIAERAQAAKLLVEEGVSQRKASEIIGISRDTIRKYTDRVT